MKAVMLINFLVNYQKKKKLETSEGSKCPIKAKKMRLCPRNLEMPMLLPSNANT